MKFYEVTITKNWIEKKLGYIHANSHKEAAEKLEKKNKRIYNDRFRQIEQTGEYYRITSVPGNVAFIFEVIN